MIDVTNHSKELLAIARNVWRNDDLEARAAAAAAAAKWHYERLFKLEQADDRPIFQP